MDVGDHQLFIHLTIEEFSPLYKTYKLLLFLDYTILPSTVIIEILEWIFWIIILSITGIGMIYCCFKCSQKGKHWLGKWKVARNSATEDREFEKIRMGYVISTLELAGYGNDVEQ